MDFPAKVTKYLKGTLTLKNIPFKMNIYVKESSVSVTKVTMASFERRFLTIKVTKFASTSHHHGNPRNYRYVYFYLWFVVCKFRNDFRCSSVINWLIMVQ